MHFVVNVVVMNNIGRVLFINADGKFQFSALYGMPSSLREPELYTEHGVYRQNYQLPDGRHVYKYERPLVGVPDRFLTDYIYGTDAGWDGPPPPPRKVNWDDLNAKLGVMIRTGEVTTLELLDLQRLAYAAFHGLTMPSEHEPKPQSATRQAPPPLRPPDEGHDFDGFILEE